MPWLTAAGVLGLALLIAAYWSFGMVRERAWRSKQRDAESELFRQHARILLDQARAEQGRVALAWEGLRKFYIDRKQIEAKDVCSFYLKPFDRKPIPPFLPGQYLTFNLRLPGRDKPLIRCYSLSDSPYRSDWYRVTIKRLGPPPKEPDAPPGLSSSHFHEALNEGDVLDIKAPSGHFHLDVTGTRPVVLIGGGVGLTPVLSMLQAVCDSGSKRETWFFYGVRNREEHAMFDTLKQLAAEHENVHIAVCYSHPNEGDVEGEHYDYNEFVSVALFKRLLPSNNYEFYICGPPPMMQAITKDLQEWGVPDSDINYEAFGPATVKRQPQAQQAIAEEAGTPHTVVFARSGKTVQWNKDAGFLLDLAEASGVDMDSGCRAGNCGTCLCTIKEGTVHHSVEPGAPVDEGQCLPCIAVPSGDKLVLDA